MIKKKLHCFFLRELFFTLFKINWKRLVKKNWKRIFLLVSTKVTPMTNTRLSFVQEI